MRSRIARWVRILFVAALLLFKSSDSFSGTGEQGFNLQGFNLQGFNLQGFNLQGFNLQGFNLQGFNLQGFNLQGFNLQGFNLQGFNLQGFNLQGFNLQGFNLQGFNLQGFNLQGFNLQGFNLQGFNLQGIDRLGGFAAPLEYRGMAYANVQAPAADLQRTQQQGTPINYVEVVNPTTGVQLQASPTDAGYGNYVFVPNRSNTPNDIKGTLWNMVLGDGTTTGAIGVYVSDVMKDTAKNTSKFPSNDDVYLYTLYYRHPATGQWLSLCPVDGNTGKPTAMAMPLNPGDWKSPASRAKFTFACTASGVGAKCARNWGYKPWKPDVTETLWLNNAPVTKPIPFQPFYDACLISARADYCQDGQSYTKNGTLVDLFDTLDGFTSLNATAGLPYAPNASGPMMHEEYQISAVDTLALPGVIKPQTAVSPNDPILMSLSAEDRAAMLALRRSGLQSSRYADLDPGRSCRASGYIDRCDPSEIYSCYRDDNMSENAYGAFIAVNSPRHCDHNEDTDGAPLDPLCNSCVARVCAVDPTCCGNAGNSHYPGSLVWDARCGAIRQKVCKSGASDPVWKAGDVAPVAGGKPTVFLRGATGALDGVVIQSGTPYLEGWACDPDFPGASSTIQVSVGGPIGAGTRLITARADLGLTNLGARAEVAAECGTGRHAFRVQLLPTDVNATVYVYGFDLNLPSAPFSLLRGGKKTIPGAALGAPRAAIWSGWVEPSVSGQHTFSVAAGANDSYRVWVNGQYVAAKWPNPDTMSPAGSFTAPPPAPSMFLQQGVRYGVRVEYLRNSTTDGTSTFALRWVIPSTVVPPPPPPPPVDIPTTALHAVNPGAGNGLLGSYYQGGFGPTPYSQTWGPVDHVWTMASPPGKTTTAPVKPGLSLASSFSARFEGQVMPPLSGTYAFSADTDGAVSIWVNGKAVTTATQRPAGFADPATCDHDVCRTGGPIDRACSQGYFCAAQICKSDPYCCSTTWDAACLQKVPKVCNVDCRQTKPAEIVLQAGVKYDIKVELQHDATEFGAKLRLFWAIDGGGRDVIPVQRLFATPNPAPAVSGFGINGAYFSDDFKTQVLDHLDTRIGFATNALPKVDRLASIVCGYTGVSCASDVIGQPGLTSPLPGQSILAQSMTFTGAGAINNVTVTVTVKDRIKNTTVGTVTGPANGSGAFTTSALVLPTGTYTAAATQPGSSAIGTPIDFDFTVGNPALAPAPVVTVPKDGIVTTTGATSVGGTATAGTKVTVTVTKKTAPAATTTYPDITVTGTTWTLPLVLPAAGLYTVTATQLVNGSPSATSTSVDVKYALPPISVDVDKPAPGQIFTTGTVTVAGNATPGLGQVIVGDGDGRYFAERPANRATVASSGRFTLNVTGLDPGSHVLNVFQRLLNADGSTTNLDSAAVQRTVIIKPAAPPASMAISSPWENERVGNQVTVIGSNGPSRSGLRSSVVVYQGTNATPVVWTRVGQADIADDGTFELPVTLAGSGKTKLSFAVIARSLSGGGTAESDRGAFVRNVVIAPPPPVLSKPNPAVNPIAQTSQTLAVQGTGVTGAEINVLIDGQILSLPSKIMVVNSAFPSTNVTVPKGVHTLAFAQTLDGQMSSQTVLQTLKIGDVQPPMITVGLPGKQPPSTTSETGAVVDVVTLRDIKATDNNGASFLQLTCYPPISTTVPLPVGTTTIVCKAQDAAGNISTTSQSVTVTNSAGPTLTGNSLIVEATGPQGAAVPFQVSATGLVANCATGGAGITPCSGWRPADTGLGFHVSSVAVDPKDGALYANAYVDLGSVAGTLFRQDVPNGPWTKLSVPGPTMDPRTNIAFKLWSRRRLTVARGALASDPSTLYIPTENGLLASTDRGASAKMILSGISVRAVRVDPTNPKHVFAWNEVYVEGGPVALFETTDGGASWRNALEDLVLAHSPEMPYPHLTDVLLDPVRPGWVYLQVAPESGGTQVALERVYRKKPGKPWERLVVPPPVYPFAHRLDEAGFAIASNGSLFAAGLKSRDGGETWDEPLGVTSGLGRVLVDWQTSGRIFAEDGGEQMMISTDFGEHFTPLGNPAVGQFADLTLDPVRPGVIYGAQQSGLLQSVDMGKTWSPMKAPGTPAKTFTILDVASNPADAQVAYVLSTDGFYRTGDGGSTWRSRMNGIQEVGGADLTLDPFNYQNLYMSEGSRGGYPVLTWTDRNTDPPLPWTTASYSGFLTADPAVQNTFFSVVEFGSVVRKITQGVAANYALNVSGAEHGMVIQAFPDAARTVAVSYFLDGYTQGGTFAFSARDAQLAPAITNVVPLLTGAPVRPVFDNSDGQDTLYVSGEALGSTRDRLYKASLADALARGNAAFSPLGSSHAPINFVSLVIDRGGGGRVMYALDDGGGLWESQDRGVTWSEDTTSPSFIRRLWSSPGDGAIYANVSPKMERPAGNVISRYIDVGEQTLWKRAADAMPPGAGLVRGDLRVKCSAGGRAYTPGSVFPLGVTSLTCTATDVFKKTGTLAPAITIDVRDTTPPVINVTPPATVNVTSTDPNVTVSIPVTVTAIDKVDGARSLTCNFPAGNLYRVGVTQITCTAADSRGNSASRSFPVSVTRNGVATAPILNVPASLTVEGNFLGGAKISPVITATKAGGGALTPTCTPAATATFAVGTTSVSCSVTDAGITVTRSFPVTVTDTKGPTITPPSLGTIASQGSAGARVPFTVNATDLVDGCIAPSASALVPGATPPCAPAANAGLVTCAPASNSMFAQGRTTVTCRANDKRGNISTKAFDVLVTDVNEPVVNVPTGVVLVEAQDLLGARASYTITATDVEDGTAPVDCAPLSGSWFPFGDSTVSCQATDRNGNTGRATFMLRVVDRTPPELTVPAATITVEASATLPSAPVPYVVKAFDLVKTVVTPVCARSNGVNAPIAVTPGAIFPVGDNLVTCTATDDYANTAMKQFHVVVVDTKGPILTLPATTYAQADATGTAAVSYVATATDWGVLVPVTCTPPPRSRFAFGTTAVQCVARDAAGNESRGTFNVVVRDTVAPVIAAVSNKTAFATSTAGAAFTYTLPTANDVVDGARPVTCTPASGTTFAPNVTTVSCSASDKSGNTGTRTFTVWVQYQTVAPTGGVFLPPLLANGSAVINRTLGTLEVAFPLTGPSAPITNLSTARLTIAPVVGGVVGTFVNPTPASGTGNLFTYDSVGKRYVFRMALGAMAGGIYRLHAELGDGVTRELDFTLSTAMTFAPLTLAADWTAGVSGAAAPASALADGVVYLRGAMAGTGTGRPFQMPVGQRPQATVTLAMTSCNAVKGTLQIESDGWAFLLGDPNTFSCLVSFEGLSYVVNNSANTAMTLATGWTNAGAPWRNASGMISSDVVHLAGAISTSNGNALAFTLPANMRPAANVYVPINLCSPRKGRLTIASTGTVSVSPETGSLLGCSVSLEGVTFPVAPTAANGWTCLTPANGWTANPFTTRSTCVKNVDGVIRLSGAAATTGTNMNVLTLPVGLRPSKESYIHIDMCGGTSGWAQVSPSGNVSVKAATSATNATCFSSFESAAFSL